MGVEESHDAFQAKAQYEFQDIGGWSLDRAKVSDMEKFQVEVGPTTY